MTLARWVDLARAGSSTAAVVTLVAFNLLPLVGVIFLGWDLLSILVLYWIESGVVGLLNVPKMLLAAAATSEALPLSAGLPAARLIGLVFGQGCMVPFFAVHYGVFWIGHGVFVFALPGIAAATGGPGVSGGFGTIEPLVVIPGAIALAASHLVSFVTNFLGRQEYRHTTVSAQMMAPYARVFVLHLTIVLGAFLIASLGTPLAALALMVVLKTAIDLALHLRERQKARTKRSPHPA
jgi:hypothetical protein